MFRDYQLKAPSVLFAESPKQFKEPLHGGQIRVGFCSFYRTASLLVDRF
jgi:hypothetical protein